MVEIKMNAIRPEMEESLDLLQYAWTILANVSQGDWRLQDHDWQIAVKRWRDQYHALLEQYYIDTGLDGTRAPKQP